MNPECRVLQSTSQINMKIVRVQGVPQLWNQATKGDVVMQEIIEAAEGKCQPFVLKSDWLKVFLFLIGLIHCIKTNEHNYLNNCYKWAT